MILIEVSGLTEEYATTELRELVTGLSLFGHELVLCFSDHVQQRQFEDAEWEEVRDLLETVTLTCCPSESPEKQILREQAQHLFRFTPVKPTA